MAEAGATPGSAPERISSFERDGLHFDVLDEGPIAGDVVVLLHGFPERATSWRAVAPLLHAAGLRTLAPDQRGYSPGARPPRRRDYEVTGLADDIAALIDRTGGSAHVVGHDWGAVVAWTLTTNHPELVRTLTAVSVPHTAAFLRALLTTRQGLKSWYMGFFQLPRVPERVAARRGGPFDALLAKTGMSGDDVARFRREIVDYGALPGGLNWYRALPFSLRNGLKTPIAVPTTMVWSDGDTAIDRAGVDRTAQHVAADYRLVVLEGVTHWIPTQAPQALATAILARVATAAPEATGDAAGAAAADQG